MEAISKAKLMVLKQKIHKTCLLYDEKPEEIEFYIEDILKRAKSYDHVLSCFDKLIEDAPKKVNDVITFPRAKGKLYLPLEGHKDCDHARKKD